MAVIEEPEIRAFAEAIGAVDERGNYTEPRSKLAAGAVEYRKEKRKAAARDSADATPPAGTTAEQLAALRAELVELGFRSTIDILAAVAGALVRREGLHTKGSPNHE